MEEGNEDDPASHDTEHKTAHYIALHPPLDPIKDHIDSRFACMTTSKERRSKNEDGFTLVVRGGLYDQTPGGDVAVARTRFQQTGMASEV